MQIAHYFRSFVAVLCLATVLIPVHSYKHLNETLLTREKPFVRKHHHNHGFWNDSYYEHQVPIKYPGMYLTPHQNQDLLREEAKSHPTADCCPSVLEMVEPEGGKNQDDQYVVLYRNGDNRQRFYELSCHRDILNKPCRFMEKKLHNSSRCVQKYSYTYAIIQDSGGRHHRQRPSFPTFPSGPGESKWTLDYIKVRSGCSCVVTHKPKTKKKRGGKSFKATTTTTSKNRAHHHPINEIGSGGSSSDNR